MRLTVAYGTASIVVEVERVERTTLDISVMPDGVVLVRAPPDASDEAVTTGVRRRARWITGQQRYFAQFRPRTPARRWVPGETHLYLGRQHRLRIGDPDAPERVRLTRGFFTLDGVESADASVIENMMRAWYREHAATVVAVRIDEVRRRFGDALPGRIPVTLRDMRTRWASTSPQGRLTVNPSLVRAPIEGIDYVIAHELCHLRHADHGREFTELLARVMPDWEPRKRRLERALA